MPAKDAIIAGMKLKAPTSQYTLRGVPPHVSRALRKIAKQQDKSINQLILEYLNRLVGVTEPVSAAVYSDLDRLIGSWRDDPDFDQALIAQSNIDPELWK